MSDRRPEPMADGGFAGSARERASATPTAVRAEGPAGRATRSTAVPRVDVPRASVRQLQEWFAAAMMHPGSAAEGIVGAPHADALGVHFAGDVARVITAGPRLSALERFEVYHYGYRARLVECLADDYPALRHALGDEAFEALCHGYIAAHPSRGPSLNSFGRFMAGFARERAGEHARFASDLARLEWAIVETIHAPPAPAIALEALHAVAPERWASARLPASGAARVLRFDYPVNRFYQAFRLEQSPDVPSPGPSATAVYRRGWQVWRMDLTPAMTGLLEALFGGSTLSDALGTLAVHAESADAVAEAERNVMLWFREWVSGGFFARIEWSER